MKLIEDTVSIIMPVYNAEQYIYTSINSVINQTYKNWELIIINDGSTDNSEYEIRRFKDGRIKLYVQNNLGVSAARNSGLKHMKGEYFCFLDADDFFPPESLGRRIKIFKESPKIDYLDGPVKVFDQKLKNIINNWQPNYHGNPLIPLLNISGACFFSPTWMIRRKPNRTYRFHDTLSHGEDFLFFIELSLEGGNYDFIKEPILHYRKGHNSVMTDLKGLECGYHYIYNSLKQYKKVTPDQVRHFKCIAQKIIFKSYLGNYQLINAILSLLKKW